MKPHPTSSIVPDPCRVLGDGVGVLTLRNAILSATLAAMALLPLVFAPAACAQGYSVLYNFNFNKGGSSPYDGVVADASGNLYGGTRYGGTYGYGNIFELTASGEYKVLHNFTSGVDGADPIGQLMLDSSGNIYGTTQVGGDQSCGDIGCGLVFKLNPQGKETVLHTFTQQADGGVPLAGLIRDAQGNFYGTAASGGDLSGVCSGQIGCGVVFRLDPQGHETVLYTFTGSPDGMEPAGPVVRDGASNLYGTTWYGGSTSCNFGCGTVFKLDPSGNETVLYRFTGGADGANPSYGSLVIDPSGNLYGTTRAGGDLSCGISPGCGVVFKVDPEGNETVLYTFTGGADGAVPYQGVLRDKSGNLFGTASAGGSFSGICASTEGCGVIFKLSPAGVLTAIHTFAGTDGQNPFGSLSLHHGLIYGTTFGGGANGSGVIFQQKP